MPDHLADRDPAAGRAGRRRRRPASALNCVDSAGEAAAPPDPAQRDRLGGPNPTPSRARGLRPVTVIATVTVSSLVCVGASSQRAASSTPAAKFSSPDPGRHSRTGTRPGRLLDPESYTMRPRSPASDFKLLNLNSPGPRSLSVRGRAGPGQRRTTVPIHDHDPSHS